MHDSSSPCKQVIAEQLEMAIKEQNMTRTELAKRMGTSRMVINRLLDLDNTSVTLITLEKAVSALGRRLKITIE
ncbi:helix-turn-helix transcriptional regulator [Sulfuricurvum sp.]|uniref:helix-turn-helix domain-containing protein n=1 Tax=Sulfuricurvum sp. TaxID=2025608 RepID=UPI002602BD11|nr:helix-turn-helix transcriptional regulator [Sulfuricurvum sp.]MDD3595199.1 helix-turn-helix transcriptional regulator [Sulfuricurvum sp.]